MSYTIRIAALEDFKHAETIVSWYQISSKERGTGIAVRTVDYLQTRIRNENAIIALSGKTVVGFCYIERFEEKKYVSNSGLIVHPDHRGCGLAGQIKKAVFNLARDKYPDAKIFGITTSDAVMKINYNLGYRPVSFSQLTEDETFWKGCSSCPNYDILLRNQKKICLCTGMLADSKNQSNNHK